MVGAFQHGAAATSPRTPIVRLIVAALAGSALEWYDFGLYGATAALVFGPEFFPSLSPLAGTMAAFGTYAVGFLARPIGGLVFSHYGDKVGRKPVLAATLLVMGSATVLMGLLPTYAVIGGWAPVLLVLLRLVQGLGAGAEYGGAALMLVEQNPARRGFYGAFPASGVFIGLVLSLGIFAAVTTPLSHAALLAWGWRIPYLISVLIIGVGIYLRLRVSETPEYSREVRDTHHEAETPLVEVLLKHPKRVLLGMGVNLSLVGYSYVVQTFVLSYVTMNLKLPRGVALTGVVAAAALGAVTMPMFGAIADRFTARRVIMAGAAVSALFAFPFFWMLDTGRPVLIWLAIVLGLSVCVGSMFGPIAAFYADLFGTQLRYTGLIFSREVSGSIVGGFTPLLATVLVAWSGGKPWPVAIYMIVTVLIPLLCAYLARDLMHESESLPATGPMPTVAGLTPEH